MKKNLKRKFKNKPVTKVVTKVAAKVATKDFSVTDRPDSFYPIAFTRYILITYPIAIR